MKTVGLTLLAAVVGNLAGLFGGMFFIEMFSSNVHDRSVEAAMTGAFMIGPVMALVAVVMVLVYRSGRTSSAQYSV